MTEPCGKPLSGVATRTAEGVYFGLQVARAVRALVDQIAGCQPGDVHFQGTSRPPAILNQRRAVLHAHSTVLHGRFAVLHGCRAVLSGET